ncbi:hypothetical protein TNIN_383221 [Trichonephila inaurata madagascariensis]|uniref:Uncharacterized protein n=1 Tax=Trichonephila inaurata madagascariensis TaxID=2747483 RepID=A0A8X6WWK9_9ARAC|nr:hypothetical protein TNIN_383221 [Trichonephila inaurata madagascariensis]
MKNGDASNIPTESMEFLLKGSMVSEIAHNLKFEHNLFSSPPKGIPEAKVIIKQNKKTKQFTKRNFSIISSSREQKFLGSHFKRWAENSIGTSKYSYWRSDVARGRMWEFLAF